MKTIATLATLLLVVPFSAPAVAKDAIDDPAGDAFSDYWHQGKAELSSYTLEQARYGEVHPGEAVLIFVTEDFSRQKQVKLDGPVRAGDTAVPVLKLNFTKTFNTGVYPYSMMTSAFTAVDPRHQPRDTATLKVTTTSQEWCGHSFTQLNQTPNGYRVSEFSYFESEGDRTLDLEGAVLEDGLWNLIRIDPASLPQGTFRLVPAAMFQRLRHRPWRPERVEASMATDAQDASHSVYTLTYPDLGRTLQIHFATAFPHEISAWEERYTDGYGPKAGPLVTRGTLKKRIMLDYWRRNGLDDAGLRETLALD